MDLSKREDVKRIVDGCAKGKRKYQHILYKNLYGKMLGSCIRYSKDIDEAKDFVHEGFIKVFEKIKYFKQTGSLEGWIRRIIINNTIDILRKNNKILYDFDNEQILQNIKEDDNLEEIELQNLAVEKIIELIQDLSPGYRTVFNLYVIEDYSHKEIAEKLNISIGTSKSNLAKAKEKLRKMYVDKYGEFNNDE